MDDSAAGEEDPGAALDVTLAPPAPQQPLSPPAAAENTSHPPSKPS